MIAKFPSSKHSMWAGRGANVRYYRWLCLLTLIGMLLTLSQQAVAGQRVDEQTLSSIDAYIARQMDDLRIPGLALAIVHGNQIVVAKGYGVANPQGAAVTPQMPLWAGLMLVGLPAVVNLSKVGYQIPDLTAILLASGGLALGWSIVRIMWIVRAKVNL